MKRLAPLVVLYNFSNRGLHQRKMETPFSIAEKTLVWLPMVNSSSVGVGVWKLLE